LQEVDCDGLSDEDFKELKKKLEFGGFVFSASAKEKILKAGGKIES